MEIWKRVPQLIELWIAMFLDRDKDLPVISDKHLYVVKRSEIFSNSK